MLLFEAMSILETRDTAVWFDHANNRFEGDATIPETGLYSGRPFEEILVESGLLPDACAQLCDVFHTDDDNPELGIESSLQHITIGDNKGGSHLPSVIIELVPDHKFSSSLIAIKSDPATKVIKKQRMRPDGTFRLIGSGADVAYQRSGRQGWRKKRNLQNGFFPIEWTATDLILAVHDNLQEEPIYNDRAKNLQRVSSYMGVFFRTICDVNTDKVISAYPTKSTI